MAFSSKNEKADDGDVEIEGDGDLARGAGRSWGYDGFAVGNSMDADIEKAADQGTENKRWDDGEPQRDVTVEEVDGHGHFPDWFVDIDSFAVEMDRYFHFLGWPKLSVMPVYIVLSSPFVNRPPTPLLRLILSRVEEILPLKRCQWEKMRYC